jgi:hypothetical protein
VGSTPIIRSIFESPEPQRFGAFFLILLDFLAFTGTIELSPKKGELHTKPQ